jgi:GNAT superfamily N-acetyltransferase
MIAAALAFSYAAALDVLFPEGAPPLAEACARATPAAAAPLCLLGARYADDLVARDLAVELYQRTGSLAGVARAHDQSSTLRGTVHLEPHLPIGADRQHLAWVVGALTEIDGFFSALRRPADAPEYRHTGLAVRFMASTAGRTTPSATMLGWTMEYNVRGRIHTSQARVTETVFHELFHANDAAHGQWSTRALQPVYERILARCGQSTACLAPYAPARTVVTGATYYAFHADNDVREYAAELAIRYFVEQRRALGSSTPGASADPRPFKCLTPENAQAWEALVVEFFGVDLTPGC